MPHRFLAHISNYSKRRTKKQNHLNSVAQAPLREKLFFVFQLWFWCRSWQRYRSFHVHGSRNVLCVLVLAYAVCLLKRRKRVQADTKTSSTIRERPLTSISRFKTAGATQSHFSFDATLDYYDHILLYIRITLHLKPKGCIEVVDYRRNVLFIYQLNWEEVCTRVCQSRSSSVRRASMRCDIVLGNLNTPG